MMVRGLLPGFLAAAIAASAGQARGAGLDSIETIVVIYAENRSFNNLYGWFPGANGLSRLTLAQYLQRDRDGSVLRELPPIWGGLTEKGVVPAVTEEQTRQMHLPNAPFAIDDPNGFNTPANLATRSPWHLFYQNQMQINGGKNDRFVAYADTGALVMGHYDDANLPLWPIARQYTLADNFFMGGFGGSFFNHFWLICACAPFYPNANRSPASDLISAVAADRVSLEFAPDSPKSARDHPPKFVTPDGKLTPDFYAVNTMFPPYPPSPDLTGRERRTILPPQTEQTIGDLLSARRVTWAWYAGAWQAALDRKNGFPVPNFQYHHQPFNYFAAMAPDTAARAEHLRDGGLAGSEFIKAIDAGALPQVAFYKPQGNLNEHPGYADVLDGDRHIAEVIARLRNSPQWAGMVVIVTYDENGGFWDHVPPPKGDRWGPGTRIPALIVSPFAKKGFVDHTPYDTTSILSLITKRFALPPLRGLETRNAAVAANAGLPLGDLTNALELATR
jgi:acid phosphatase